MTQRDYLARLFAAPCAIDPAAVRTYAAAAAAISIETYADQRRREIAAQYKAGGFDVDDDAQQITARLGKIAVLPVFGLIDQREAYYGTSTISLARALAAVIADADVDAVALDMDTPGGSVYGVPELAAQIRAARDVKPIVAMANPYTASAGYYLAAQATEITVTPSGQAGSIGVLAAHVDYSGAFDKQGMKVTLLHAGEFKIEGNPYEPLGETAAAQIQAMLNHYYGEFLADVAAGRGIDAETVAADYGKGRVKTAPDALAAGMVDKIQTPEATLARLATASNKATRNATSRLIAHRRRTLAAARA